MESCVIQSILCVFIRLRIQIHNRIHIHIHNQLYCMYALTVCSAVY